MTRVGWLMSRRAISAAYLERKLRALSGVQGGNPLEELRDLNGLVVLENDRPEWSFPANELLGFVRVAAGAIAGQFSFAALVNRPDSGVLVIVEHIRVNNNADLFVADPSQVAAAAPHLGGETSSSSIEVLRDTRSFGRGSTPTNHAARTSAGSNAVSPWHGPAYQLTIDVPQPLVVVLEPDTALVVVGAAVNQAVVASYIFRERPIEGLVEVK